MSEAKKRCARISKSQKETLVDFMAEDKPFARGQFTDANSRQSNTETWESLCFWLNSQGPNIKTVEQWKKCWTDIKSAAKKQANEIKAFMNKTGGGSIADGPRPLSEFEEKVLSIITMDAVDGDASTPEMGLATPFLESLEIMIGAAAVETEEDEPSFEEPSSSKRKRNKTYDSALQEARAMHTSVMEKLDTVISLNKEILNILKHNYPSCISRSLEQLKIKELRLISFRSLDNTRLLIP